MKVRLFGQDGECVEIGSLRSLSIEDDNGNPIYVALAPAPGSIVGLSAGDKNFDEYVRMLGLRQAKVLTLKP